MTERMRRVDEQMKEVLAEAVGGLKDPRIGFVTVTEVRTAPDLSHAEVFYTTLEDDPDSQEATAEGLRRAAPALRRELGAAVRLKRVPDLEFSVDPAPAQGRHIETLLRQVAEQGEQADDQSGEQERP